MSEHENISLEDEAKKLLKHLSTGLFSHILISGKAEKLNEFFTHLLNECKSEGISTSTITFSAEDPNFNYEYKESDLLIIKNLGLLPAKHNKAFSLRTMLDVGQYSGLKSFILCEESKVRDHFHDYEAPFYQFCLPHRLSAW